MEITRNDADVVCLVIREYMRNLNESLKVIQEQVAKDAASDNKIRVIAAKIQGGLYSEEIKRKQERAAKCLEIMMLGSEEGQRVELAESQERLLEKIDQLIGLETARMELKAVKGEL